MTYIGTGPGGGDRNHIVAGHAVPGTLRGQGEKDVGVRIENMDPKKLGRYPDPSLTVLDHGTRIEHASQIREPGENLGWATCRGRTTTVRKPKIVVTIAQQPNDPL